MADLLSGIFSVLLVTILISTIFFYAFDTKGPWGSFWTFFIVVLLCVWIANLWIQPIGPLFYGIAWITLSIVGLLAALLLAAAPQSAHKKEPRIMNVQEADLNSESEKRYQSFSRKTATISGIFWIVMIILLIVVILGYAFE